MGLYNGTATLETSQELLEAGEKKTKKTKNNTRDGNSTPKYRFKRHKCCSFLCLWRGFILRGQKQKPPSGIN